MNLNAVFFLPNHPQLTAFNEVCKKVYGNNYIPDEINQQYLLTCLLVYNNEEPVARLCLYYNADIGEKKTLLFGNIEFIDDIFAFEKLMSEAERYAYQNGYDNLLGPINGSSWDEYRLPLTNEGKKFITDLQQPLYYAIFLQQRGYKIAQRYYTRHSKLVEQKIDNTLSKHFQEQGITIRSIDMNNYENELERLYSFCIKAFAENVYYSIIDQPEFIEKYKKVRPFLSPEFVLIAENAEQQIVAFLLCLPDVYQSNTIVMKTMARSNEPQLRGLMTHMINLFYNRAVAAGYTQLLHAFFHEANRSGILSEKYDGQGFKSYALFQKQLMN